MLDIKRVLASRPRKKAVSEQPRELFTPWGEQLLAGEAEAAAAEAEVEEAAAVEELPSERAGEAPTKLNSTSASSAEPPHPHPQFQREAWCSLDGMWDYAIQPISSSPDTGEPWRDAAVPASFAGRIRVPFSPEAPLSGVGRQLQPDEVLWYRREVDLPSGLAERVVAGQRLILHFEAVDYACAVYAGGRFMGEHKGAYLPFSFDVTDDLDGSGAVEDPGAIPGAATAAASADDPAFPAPARLSLAVCVWDPSDGGTQLRGKQRLERGGIWYTAQSGIWQTVWLETVPVAHIESVTIDPQADEGVLHIVASICLPQAMRDAAPDFSAALYDGEALVAEGVVKAIAETPEAAKAADHVEAEHPKAADRVEAEHPKAAPDPAPHSSGSDLICHAAALLTLPVPSPHLWSPDDPHLYQLKLTFGEDIVQSYTAFRTVGMERDAQGRSRFCLNHEPFFLRGLLDQGYWSDGLMTAPADEALVFDIQTAHDLGFNMLRKHIKVERDRFYYHCDRLGMLVMQDMPSGGGAYGAWQTSYKPTFFRGSWASQPDNTTEARTVLAADDAAYRAEWSATCEDVVRYLGNHPCIVSWCLFNEGWGQFDARRALECVRELDSTRAVDAVSGWYDQGCGDFQSVHNYFRPLEVYADPVQPPRAFLLSEFGGLSLAIAGHTSFDSEYGYGSYRKRGELTLGVRGLIAQAEALERERLVGFVYTQLSDVEEEVNGLVTYDRRVVKLKD